MQEGKFDLCMANKRFEYLVVYSEAATPEVIDTVVYPAVTIKHYLLAMKARGCIIYNVFRKTEIKELLEAVPLEAVEALDSNKEMSIARAMEVTKMVRNEYRGITEHGTSELNSWEIADAMERVLRFIKTTRSF